MDYLSEVSACLIDLWHPDLLPGEQAVVAEKPAVEQGPTFKLTGWRGAGWNIVFLDKPTE